MQTKSTNNPTRIVIAGAGFAGTYTYKCLHKHTHNNKDISIALINRHNHFLFTPLLHEVATGSIAPETIIEPLRKVLRCCLGELHVENIKSINTKENIITTDTHTVPYDYLVLALGSETNFYGIPGAQEHSFTLKDLQDALKLKNHIITQCERACHESDPDKRKQLLTFCVIGGGPTGVELAAELSEFLYHTLDPLYQGHLKEAINIILVQRSPELVPQFDKKIRKRSLHVLKKKNITVKLGTTVIGVSKNHLTLDNKTKVPSQTTIWVAGVKPVEIKTDVPLPRDEFGRIHVNENLKVANTSNIYALGDGARSQNPGSHKPLPALAQVATKQASITADNILADIAHTNKKQFAYRSSGELLSLGQWTAAGEIKGFTFFGRLAWWIWRTIYLSKLLSRRKKLKVATDWTLNLFSPRDISKW